MANTITNLVTTIYAALDTVSREMVGFIPAVRRITSLERAAKDETVRFPIVPAMTAGDVTPAATGPDPSAQTIGSDTLSISKSRNVTFYWEGEEEKGLGNSGIYGNILQDQFTQAFRTLVNEMETDLGALYKYSSRAYGTAGTTAFATINEMDDFAKMREILEINGAPTNDLHMVLDNAAVASIRSYQANLFKANEAGTDTLLRNGSLGQIEGMMIHQSGKVAYHTKGTAANYDASGAASAGATTMAVDGSSAGTILQGDVIVWTAYNEKYVVSSATASGQSTGNITFNNPGLITAIADTTEGTTQNSYRANMLFDRNAMVLVARPPATPGGGDAADDRMLVTDPISGITFDVAVYRQYRRIAYEVSIAWGVKAVKAEHMAILLG